MMNASNADSPIGSKSRWAGRILSTLAGLMLLLGGVMNVLKTKQAVEGAAPYGYDEYTLMPLGVVTIIAVLLYLIPQTAVLGAILITGYLGGAVATHVIADDKWYQMIIPAIFGAIVWLGLWLRDPRVRALIPLRSV